MYTIVLSISYKRDLCVIVATFTADVFAVWQSNLRENSYYARIFNDSLLRFAIRYCLQRIHSIAIICVFVRLHLCAAIYSFFSLLLTWRPCHVVFAVSTLFVFFYLPQGNCCCEFLSRSVPRILSFFISYSRLLCVMRMVEFHPFIYSQFGRLSPIKSIAQSIAKIDISG